MSAHIADVNTNDLGDCRICECDDGVGAPYYVGSRILVGRVCRSCKKEIFGVSS